MDSSGKLNALKVFHKLDTLRKNVTNVSHKQNYNYLQNTDAENFVQKALIFSFKLELGMALWAQIG